MKKRYMLSLTPENVERFRAIVKAGKLPASTLSNAVDDFIAEMNGVLTQCIESGEVRLGDIFRIMGNQFEQFIQEGKTIAEKRKEENKARI